VEGRAVVTEGVQKVVEEEVDVGQRGDLDRAALRHVLALFTLHVLLSEDLVISAGNQRRQTIIICPSSATL
jgi:hypothetical protein